MNAPHDIWPTLVAVFRAVVTASWQGSLAIALVLLARWALGMRAPARWHYLLWSVVVIRLLVPAFALPRNPASIENIAVVAHPFAGVSPKAVAGDDAGELQAPPALMKEANSRELLMIETALKHGPPRVSARPSFPWLWAARVWALGALTLMGWFGVSAARLRRRLRAETSEVAEVIRTIWEVSCRRWLGRAAPRVAVADWVASPALVGLWRPTLLIPRDAAATYSEEDWEHVFAHEIAHLRRRDQWSQLLLILAMGAHWFNPMVWVGLRCVRADRELAADEWALQHLDSERSLAYGETLFKTVAARSGGYFQPGIIGISEDGARIKERLLWITRFLPRRVYGSIAGAAAMLILSAVLLGQSVSDRSEKKAGSQSKQEPKEEQEPLKLSLEKPPTVERNVPEEILAAAEAGDSNLVRYLLNLPGPKFRAPHSLFAFLPDISGLSDMLNALLRRQELDPFTLLLDEVRKTHAGDHWDISEEILSSLVKDGRRDFLDVLLARRLELNRLSEQGKTAASPMKEWIARRVAEVGKQRADIAALEKVASDGDVAAMRKLIEGGADVNGVGADNNTPLIRAVFKDRLEAAQFLLDHGAEVDKPRFPGWDYTPLCLVHSVPMAELLKKAGANIRAKLFNRNVSILTYVAEREASDVVAWFLQQGLDPKMIGDNGETLLFDLKDAGTAELLLKAGVDPDHVNQFGTTAISTARSAEVAQKLIDYGAKVNGLPNSLLPQLVAYGSTGAIEAVIKAGADRDSATLQAALTRVDEMDKKYLPEKDKMRELFIGLGAKAPTGADAAPEILCRVTVATADGGRIDARSCLVYSHEILGINGSSTAGGTARIEADGSAPIWIRGDGIAARLAVVEKGYATAFAGPFRPPFQEMKDGIHFKLTKGFSATMQIVNEAGEAIEGARLKGYYPGPPELDFAEVTTDGVGEAVFEHIGDVGLNVRVRADGYQADEAAQLYLDAAKPYRWVLKKARPLSGTVMSSTTGEPVAGARIKLAGVRGLHNESYSDPENAPLLTSTDAQGRFDLTTLRVDSGYYLFVEAPGYGSVLLGDVRVGQPSLKVELGPELKVRGKVIHLPAGLLQGGEITAGYIQYFKIGDTMMGAGKQVRIKPVNGEAEFSIGPLYAYPVEIRIGDKTVKLDAKELPKAGVVIDLGDAEAGK